MGVKVGCRVACAAAGRMQWSKGWLPHTSSIPERWGHADPAGKNVERAAAERVRCRGQAPLAALPIASSTHKHSFTTLHPAELARSPLVRPLRL